MSATTPATGRTPSPITGSPAPWLPALPEGVAPLSIAHAAVCAGAARTDTYALHGDARVRCWAAHAGQAGDPPTALPGDLVIRRADLPPGAVVVVAHPSTGAAAPLELDPCAPGSALAMHWTRPGIPHPLTLVLSTIHAGRSVVLDGVSHHRLPDGELGYVPRSSAEAQVAQRSAEWARVAGQPVWVAGEGRALLRADYSVDEFLRSCCELPWNQVRALLEDSAPPHDPHMVLASFPCVCGADDTALAAELMSAAADAVALKDPGVDHEEGVVPFAEFAFLVPSEAAALALASRLEATDATVGTTIHAAGRL